MDNIIEMKNIYKNFCNNEILKELNLTIHGGDFVSIMGESGAGKSTLLNILGLLEKQTKGDFLINGESTKNLTSKDQAIKRNELIGFVMQDFSLIEKYTVMKNIQIPLIYNRKKQKLRNYNTLIYEKLNEFGLKGKEDQIVSSLSGGERQRVALIRAIVNNPQIILADEPTSALDKENAQYICNFLKNMNKYGKTVIIVTHDISVAQIANRQLQLQNGKLSENHNMNQNNIQ